MNNINQKLYSQMESAVTLQNNGQLDRARVIYHQIFQQHPTQPNALHNLALIEHKQGNTDEAIKLFEKCTKSNNEYYQAKFCLAELYNVEGKYREAANLYNQGYIQDLKLDNPKLKLNITLKGVIHYIINTAKNNQPFELSRIKNFSTSLIKSEQFDKLLIPLIKYIDKTFILSNFPERIAINAAIVISHLLGLNKDSPKNWNDIVFKSYHFPMMEKALETGYLDLLLEFETLIYNNYVKQTETEEHFNYCFNKWLPLMRAAGENLKQAIPPVEFSPNKAKKPKLAFFFHNTSTMAHTQIVLNFIKGMNSLDQPPYRVKVYFFCGDHQPTIQKFIQLGAEVSVISNAQHKNDVSFVNRIIILRNMIKEDDVSALLWITLPTLMSFAFALHVAPIQIWWGMKYHNLESPDIDAYIGLGAFEKFRNMHENKWRIGHTVYASHYTTPKPEKVIQEKSKFDHFNTVISSLARTEKINNNIYLSTISDILKENPDTCYLWSGDTEIENIKNFFIEQGIQDQCFFIGWVDTKLYAEVIDIYLDSFPFPCATTIIDSMLCGKPIVMMNTKESREIGIPMLISPILESDSVSPEQRDDVKRIFQLNTNNTEDEKLLLIANDVDEYQNYANKLIKNVEFRKKSGEAYQLFTKKYLQDLNLMTASYCEHFSEILENHNMGMSA